MLTRHDSYTPNLLGRRLRHTTARQMRKGIGGWPDLQAKSKRIGAA